MTTPAHHTPTPVLADAPKHGTDEPHKAKAKAKPATVSGECEDLQKRFETALAADDKDEIEDCWNEMDALYEKHGEKGKPEDRDPVVALARRFHHFSTPPEPSGEAKAKMIKSPENK